MAIQIRTSLAEPETGETFVPHKPARPDKAEGGKLFKLVSEYEPAGDQPTAIRELVEGIGENGEASQVLLGVTGSGKTFTMVAIIDIRASSWPPKVCDGSSVRHSRNSSYPCSAAPVY